MERVNKIIKHYKFQECLQEITRLEAERIFCKHDFTHFLEVARVAYILNLENDYKIPKAEIYAVALLHDIGRHEQYLNGRPHHEASAELAEGILKDCGFLQEERARILHAILEHRTTGTQDERLSELICKADKISRPCFQCQAEAECNWSLEKKNLDLRY